MPKIRLRQNGGCCFHGYCLGLRGCRSCRDLPSENMLVPWRCRRLHRKAFAQYSQQHSIVGNGAVSRFVLFCPKLQDYAVKTNTLADLFTSPQLSRIAVINKLLLNIISCEITMFLKTNSLTNNTGLLRLKLNAFHVTSNTRLTHSYTFCWENCYCKCFLVLFNSFC